MAHMRQNTISLSSRISMILLVAFIAVGCRGEEGDGNNVVSYPLLSLQHDMGDILWGDVATHTFILAGGGLPKQVLESKASCSCAVAALSLTRGGSHGDRVPYEYGANIPGDAELHVGVRVTPGTAGSLEEQVWLKTSGRDIRIAIRATVVPLLAFSPAVLDLGDVPEGGEIFGTVHVWSPVVTGLELLVAHELRSGWHAELCRPIGDDDSSADERWTLNVRFEDPVAETRLRSISIPIYCASWKDLALPHLGPPPATFIESLPVKVEVVTPVYARPPYISLGKLSVGRNSARTKIKAFEADTLAGLDVGRAAFVVVDGPRSIAESFSCTLDGKNEALECEISFVLNELAAEGTEGVLRGEVRIPLDHRYQAELILPVFGILPNVVSERSRTREPSR